MTRVCFVGNSHLAAVKLGWKAVRSGYPGIDAHFFGAPTRQFASIAVEDGLLVPKSDDARRCFRLTSGGQASAVLADYDVVVLIALGLSLAVVLDVYASYRADDQRNSEGDFELVSPAYFHEIAKARLAVMPALTYLNKIREATVARGTEIWLYPQPMPSIAVLASNVVSATPFEATRISTMKQAVAFHDEEVLHSAFAALCADLAQVSSIFSREEYARGSVRLTKNLNIAHPEDDYAHMNAKYGAIVMRQILERVATRPV
jgi:hypothetical protein